jgi:hypothetical protein
MNFAITDDGARPDVGFEARNPTQWMAGAAVAQAVVARSANDIMLIPSRRRVRSYRHAQATTIYGGTSEVPP